MNALQTVRSKVRFKSTHAVGPGLTGPFGNGSMGTGPSRNVLPSHADNSAANASARMMLACSSPCAERVRVKDP
jgi:hypothetical protein